MRVEMTTQDKRERARYFLKYNIMVIDFLKQSVNFPFMIDFIQGIEDDIVQNLHNEAHRHCYSIDVDHLEFRGNKIVAIIEIKKYPHILPKFQRNVYCQASGQMNVPFYFILYTMNDKYIVTQYEVFYNIDDVGSCHENSVKLTPEKYYKFLDILENLVEMTSEQRYNFLKKF